MADLGLPGSVVEIVDAAWQRDVWEVRKAGLNIMMSMKGDGKPVSFIEDCAVPLEHLADYTERLTQVFAKHGTRGTFYAHASVGCLHVRPVLNLRTEHGAKQMRAIAEEACALVKEYKGSYSGEHGDGLVRSEWIEPVYGARLTRAFGEIKQAFDPKGLMNPGKIVAAPKMDDRSLFRFKPDYQTTALQTGLDWSEHEVGPENRGRGFAAAVEMCNNNGHCRKFDAGAMCPSYRVDARRAARDTRPGELAAPRVVGPTRARCAGVAAALRHSGLVRVLQGLQARVSDRRRHGGDEGRVPASLSPPSPPLAARPARRAPAALRARGRPLRATSESARSNPGACQAFRGSCGVRRPPNAAEVAARLFSGDRATRFGRDRRRA